MRDEQSILADLSECEYWRITYWRDRKAVSESGLQHYWDMLEYETRQRDALVRQLIEDHGYSIDDLSLVVLAGKEPE